MKIRIKLSSDSGEAMFMPEHGNVYWLSGWEALITTFKFVLKGHDVEIVE